jgi:hypothetical protein
MYRYSTDPKNILEEDNTVYPLYGFAQGRMDCFYRGNDNTVIYIKLLLLLTLL